MPSKPKVFVTRRIPEGPLARVLERCDAEVWPEQMPPPAGVLRAKAADCDGLVALLTDRIDGPFLDACPRLRVVSNFAVGYNNIDVPAATARGVAVGNTPGVLTDATADMAFLLLLSAARRLVESVRDSVEGEWKTWEPLGYLGQDLAGKTLGIVGMGRIGFALARRCHRGWDMPVIYHDRHRHAQAESELGARAVELEVLLRQADFVSVHTDLNESTKGMFNAARFGLMKRTAVFVNTARGGVVVEADLMAALRAGTIFAAGLDVTDPEPPPPDSPLFRTPHLTVAPHIASATVGTRDAMAEICVNNLLAGLDRTPLPHPVNPGVTIRGGVN